MNTIETLIRFATSVAGFCGNLMIEANEGTLSASEAEGIATFYAQCDRMLAEMAGRVTLSDGEGIAIHFQGSWEYHAAQWVRFCGATYSATYYVEENTGTEVLRLILH